MLHRTAIFVAYFLAAAALPSGEVMYHVTSGSVAPTWLMWILPVVAGCVAGWGFASLLRGVPLAILFGVLFGLAFAFVSLNLIGLSAG
jgi:hypothetical protein